MFGISLTAANQQKQRAEQTRSLYAVPVTRSGASATSSPQRLDGYVQHSKVAPSYSAAACSGSGGSSNSYTPVYDHHRSADVYRKQSDDVVYAVPKATPTVILGEEYQESSHFQRQDWFRRKSHTRKHSGNKDDSPRMRRSASDESLANLPTSMLTSPEVSGSKKPASHRKGRAPAPPVALHQLDCMELSRSQSDANLGLASDASGNCGQDEGHCRISVPVSMSLETPSRPKHPAKRSQSTPHIDEVDRSYDSSTLSDDDSTPHVSRSNSRGKDYRAVNSAWETAYGALTVPVPAPIHIIVSQDGSGSIIYPNLTGNYT